MITLSSDFGSPYPAAMKGVILDRCDAQLVDVAHDFPRQDVRATAFWLREVLPYFPPAVHLVVVDPGVGTDRDALVVQAGDHVLVGPDNGMLAPVARKLATGAGSGTTDVEWYAVDVSDPASSTFHGRDVFAPIAADVHDASFEEYLHDQNVSRVADPVDLELPMAHVEGDRAPGEVLAVDGFGNVITNVPGSFIADSDVVTVEDTRVPAVETFAAVEPGKRLATVGSHGYVELDVNQASGDKAFDLSAGDAVRLERR